MKLKNISTIITGNYYSFSPNANGYYLQARDFTSFGELSDFISPSISIVEENKNILKNGDILLVAKGSNFNAYIFQELNLKAIASSVFLIIRVTSGTISSKYLNWFLNTRSTQKLLQSIAKGTSIPAINKQSLSEIEIPIPSLKEQELIVSIENLRKKEKILITKLENLKESYYQNLLLNKISNAI